MDALVGRIEARLRQRDLLNKTKIIILSDHGFSQFDTKVHLNRWLLDHNYLIGPSGSAGKGSMMMANWSRTQAYAIGLNSIYLNLAGREGQGSVSPDEKEAVANRIRDDLLQLRDERGRQVVGHVWHQHEAFDGPLTSYGPDLVVGFASGFRASAQTGLGEWEAQTLEANRDHWNADHCIDPMAVPGVLFTNAAALADFPKPSYRDIPALSIGAQPDDSQSTPTPTSSGDEDERVVEDRLRSLGYL
jgi:predicted AlkP superfamily phosphohydrolase/phosphomutase